MPIEYAGSITSAMQDKTVGIIGGGPAGSFAAYLLARKGVSVDIFEPRPTSVPDKLQPCTGCAGWLQENAVDLLNKRGIDLPDNVIQANIDRAVIHLTSGKSTELPLTGITAYRGFGPVSQKDGTASSFDAHLLNKAVSEGAVLHASEVSRVAIGDQNVKLTTAAGETFVADFTVGAFGHNQRLMDAITYPKKTKPMESPLTQRASVREYYLGGDKVEKAIGNSVHIFNNPTSSVWFAAVVPKQDYFSVVLMGRNDVKPNFFNEFLENNEVVNLLGQDIKDVKPSCACLCKITVKSPQDIMVPGKDDKILMVNIGDAGPTRPRKNGMYAALDSADHLASALLSQGNTRKAMDGYRRYITRNYIWDNSFSDYSLSLIDWVANHEQAAKALAYLASHDTPLSTPVKRIMQQLVTGDSPYWTIPLNALRAIFTAKKPD